MIRIEVLGPGCPRCEKLEENVRSAVQEMGIRATILTVSDPAEIAARGVFTTPGLAIKGETVSSGHLLSPGEVKTLLEERISQG